MSSPKTEYIKRIEKIKNLNLEALQYSDVGKNKLRRRL